MALETGTYISDLVATNPTASDPVSQADDHMRFIKSAVKNTFPNIAGAVNASHGDLNAVTEGPCFRARRTSSQSVVSGVTTKVQLPTEDFDLTNAFDNVTNHRFQPATAGYYQVSGSVYASGTNITLLIVSIYKNGANYADSFHTVPATGDHKLSVSDVVYLNGSTDYVELFGSATGSTANFMSGSFLSGGLLRPA